MIPAMAKFLRAAFLAAVFSALCMAGACAECLGSGTLASDALLYAQTDPGAEVLASPVKGETLVVLEDLGEGWYKVDYQTTEGYISSLAVTVSAQADVDLGHGLVRVDGSTLNVRSGAGTDFDQVGFFGDGQVAAVLGVDNGWYKVQRGSVSGYVSSDYMILCDEEGHRADGNGLPPLEEAQRAIVDYALQYLGVPYVWGGNGPDVFDCSGFSKYVYGHFGYELNRTASAQLSNGVSVSLGELQPGDLVFFDNGRVTTPVSHVGIYIGGGQFVHASTNHYMVEITDLSGHYINTFVYARRILPQP